MILLATPDLGGVFARLRASDAEVVQEPTEQPFGVRFRIIRWHPLNREAAALTWAAE